jgi:hypothetical protein
MDEATTSHRFFPELEKEAQAAGRDAVNGPARPTIGQSLKALVKFGAKASGAAITRAADELENLALKAEAAVLTKGRRSGFGDALWGAPDSTDPD